MILKEVYDKTLQHFVSKSFCSPRLETDLLLSSALNLERIDLYTKFELPLNRQEVDICREYIRRRVKGEPLAYICGYKYFYKEKFYVSPGVLIPRPDSETIIEVVLTRIATDFSSAILDLGAGSGCLGLSLLAELKAAKLISVDDSSDALAMVEKNCKHLGLDERNQNIKCDLYQNLPNIDWNEVGLIVSNPPYISYDDKYIEEQVKEYEPEAALFAGDNGLLAYKEWLPKIIEQVKTDTLFVLEFGFKQKLDLQSIIETWSIKDIEFKADLAGNDRVLSFRKA